MQSQTEFRDDHGELLANLFRSAHDAVICKSLNGVITLWNKGAERLFGFSAKEAVGSPMSILVPPALGIEESRILEQIAQDEVVEELETERLRKDGSRIHVSMTVSPVHDRGGNIIGALNITREITPRRLAQEKAQQESEQLRITLASIGDAIIATDEQGRITFLNPVAEKLTGWRCTEATGHALESVFHIIDERTRRRAENPVTRVIQEGAVTSLAEHTVLVAKDHVERAIDDSAAPIRRADGTVAGAVLVFRDVTPQRSAEEARARLAAIVESSDDAIIGKDLNGRVTSWNTGAERIFGFKAEEMIGRHISLLIPPAHLKEETEILSRLRRGERVEHFETVRFTKTGGLVDVSLTVSPVKNLEGTVIGASKIARDITAQKRIQEDLRQAKENLERSVQERTARLREAVTDLEHFSYSMSHDLRAPLRSIASFSAILLSDYHQKLEPEAVSCLRRICASAERMDRLLIDALSYTRLARTEITLEQVDLDRVLREMLQHYPNFHPESMDLEFDRPLLPVAASEALVAQCLSNLLGNSAKFVAPGTKPHVRIWTEEQDGTVRVCIKDNGIGIPANELDRVWRIFERGHPGKGYDGTGIGLSLVKRAVERMGGRVGVESEPGKGSTFWFVLPNASSIQSSEFHVSNVIAD